MKNKYPHIFEPITVRRMTVKNRIVMTPMGTNYGEQNGEMSFLHINYYEQRAKGGTGLIIVENASVDSPQGSNGTTQLRIDLDNYIPRLFKLCESVHKHGACIAIQLNHAGASAMSSRIGMQPVSASDVPSKAGGEIPRPLEKDEIMHIVKKYGEAAKRAQAAGFDAVEIHAGHSYLISQFLSPITNKRTDEFGGSAENRARFAKLVIEEVRKQVGPFFPIFVRISADELMEGGNTLEDTLELLSYFQEEVDAFDVSAGLNGSLQFQIDANYLKDGWRSYMAKLTHADIHTDDNGDYWIIDKRQKTGTQFRVKLLPVAEMLYKRYKDTYRTGEKVFPLKGTYKTLNMSLRHVARHAGLSFNPTIHMARHTFATTVTLTQGVPLETVCKMLGHKRITTTQIYAKITNDKIGQDMAALSEKLSSVFKVAQ